MIYLDYAATSPVHESVVQVVQQALSEQFGNPSSTYTIGKKAKQAMQHARQQVASALSVPVSTLYFTSGATEANNWAIRSQAMTAKALGLGQHIVCSTVEHPSVRAVCEQLAQEGFELTYVQPEDAVTTLSRFEAASRADTIGWICMAVNNETGNYYPVAALSQAAQARDIWLHVDAVQAVGRLDWNWSTIGTSITLSGHKLQAPKGIGVLCYQPWQQTMQKLRPLIVGGGQEQGMRSGTENIPYILGLAKAVELASAHIAERQAHDDLLYQHLVQALQAQGIAFERNGTSAEQVPGIVNLWIRGILASQLLIQSDLAQIYISAGSACSAGSLEPSKVLQAYYPDQPERWQESIRISFGLRTTTEELDQLVQVIKQLTERKETLWHLQNKQH